jgi:arylsulfatase A-like enzyme
MDVPRDQVVAFALYTHDQGVLKLTAQLYPLKPEETRGVRLELKKNGDWMEVARERVVYPGWSAHFRIENWDSSVSVPYRVRHGAEAMFEGLVRKDPADKDVIVVGNLSCNSSSTPGPRKQIVENLKAQDPDLLFFAGDQSYRHHEATVGWIEFGLQFREVMRDRPTVTIPDDHDVGHGNLWGENGKKSTIGGHADGGYRYPPKFVNMVERQQTWHLPDPVDPEPVEQGIGVYFTNLRLGGIDFAILEDRKFKSGPAGKIPKMGPRPDHINDPDYDPNAIDLPGLELLGARQEKFLEEWSEDWTGAEMKAVLSQTAFCGAVHIHGNPTNRLLADLDCNGWPQTPRKRALELIRRAKAVHLCGDQHLSVVVKHGIDKFGDGPYAFTSPAIVNTVYGRWWHPADEKAGPNPVPDSPLPWTGDFHDGLGNKISMMAYANPENRQDERKRSDGYGIARFNRKDRTVTFEAWPRFASVAEGDQAQFPGWPITVSMDDNDGRKVTGYLPELVFAESERPVIQVIDESTQDVLYTIRAASHRFSPGVYSEGPFTIKCGRDRPEQVVLESVKPGKKGEAEEFSVSLTALPTKPQVKNVLLIMSDDLKASALPAYGNTICKTPNLDRLAASSLVFERAYCQGLACAPSRPSMMRSVYPNSRVTALTIGEHLQQHGYHTARVGKIFHMGVPDDPKNGTSGLDVPACWTERHNTQSEETFTPGLYRLENRGIATREMKGRQGAGTRERPWASVISDQEDGSDQADHRVATKAVELLRQRKAEGKPFFLGVGFFRPHYPMVAPKKFFDMYPLEAMKIPPLIPGELHDIPQAGRASMGDGLNETEEGRRRMWQAYYASVTFMDEQVGRVLNELDRLGLRDSTAIIFTTDHGYHLGEHGFWQKMNLHEEVTRIPFMVRGTGIQPGRTLSLVELVDMYPTCTDLLGLPTPKELQGKSLGPILENPNATVRDTALSMHRQPYGAIRAADWHYMNYGSKGEELYDMVKDPHQYTNLVNVAAYADLLKEARLKYEQRIADAQIMEPAPDKKRKGQPAS